MNIWSITKPLVDWKWPFLTTATAAKSMQVAASVSEALLGNTQQSIASTFQQNESMSKDIASNNNSSTKDRAFAAEEPQNHPNGQTDTGSETEKLLDSAKVHGEVKHKSVRSTVTKGDHPSVQLHSPLHVKTHHGYGRVNTHGHHVGRHKPNTKTYRPPYHDAGAYIELKHGLTYYELHGFEGEGSEDKEIVVLLHGLSWWSFTWELMVPYLVSNNYRVITFDFYGRGLSAAPTHLKYDHELLAEQTHELLTKLNLKRKVHMVGFSMGGGTAGTFASKYHHMLKKLVLIGPVGTPVQMPLVGKIVGIPVVGRLFYWAFAKLAMQRSLKTDQCKSDFVKPEKVAHLLGRYVDYSEWCIESKEGFFEALYSTTMNFPFSDLLNVYNKIPSTLPVLLIWGEKDHLVPVQNHKLLLEAMPHAKFINIPDAGHTCFLEEPDAIHQHIGDFFATPSAQKPQSHHKHHNRSHGPHFFHHKPVHIPSHTHAFHTLAIPEDANTTTTETTTESAINSTTTAATEPTTEPTIDSTTTATITTATTEPTTPIVTSDTA